MLEHLLELVQGHTVTGCDIGDRLIQRAVINTGTGTVGQLQLQVLNDEPLQHLLLEHLLGRKV